MLSLRKTNVITKGGQLHQFILDDLK